MFTDDRKGVEGKVKRNGIKIFCISMALLCCAACAFPGTARADDARLFFLSPTYSWYFPSSGKAKSAFGSTWEGFGVALNMETFGWSNKLSSGFRLHPYFGFYHSSERGNEAYVVPIGLEARWQLEEAGAMRPYFGIGLAGYGVSLEDKAADVDTGWRAAFGGRVMVGADITKWLNLQASYNVVSDVKGYDLSGFGIQAKINLYF